MICVLCDGPFEFGQRVIQVSAKVVEYEPAFQQLVLVPALFQNGEREGFAHEKCVYEHGTPLLLVGADHNWRPDV